MAKWFPVGVPYRPTSDRERSDGVGSRSVAAVRADPFVRPTRARVLNWRFNARCPVGLSSADITSGRWASQPAPEWSAAGSYGRTPVEIEKVSEARAIAQHCWQANWQARLPLGRRECSHPSDRYRYSNRIASSPLGIRLKAGAFIPLRHYML